MFPGLYSENIGGTLEAVYEITRVIQCSTSQLLPCFCLQSGKRSIQLFKISTNIPNHQEE